jgi:hypothetical protein
MSEDETSQQPTLEPKRKTAARFGVHVKTIDRWAAAGILEPPTKINGRDYFNRSAKPATA